MASMGQRRTNNTHRKPQPKFPVPDLYGGDAWARITDAIDEPHPVADALSIFISEATSLRDVLEPLLHMVEEQYVTAKVNYSRLREALDTDAPEARVGRRRPRHDMPPSKQTRYLRARRTFDDSLFAQRNVPHLFLLGLMSEYDAFLARLIRALFDIKSDLARSIDRALSISDLAGLTSIEDAVSFIIEKEVETTLRGSREEQLAWFERRFGLTLRAFEVLPQFIEISERRNIVAHNAGIVTNRYLASCKRSDLSPGEEIGIDVQYLRQAYDVMVEVAVGLAMTVWRKVRPDELELSDKVLSRICYTLLVFEEFELAKSLLTFAVGLPRHSSEHERRKMVVNLAQSYKWLGDEEGCREILSKDDWTASEDAFMLANRVLEENFQDAVRLMLLVAQNGDVPEAAFRDWPLFRQFRESPLFPQAFEEAFGREFVP